MFYQVHVFRPPTDQFKGGRNIQPPQYAARCARGPPQGRHVAICPATMRNDVQCATCGICANATRKAIIGFPAHGSGAKRVQAVFFAKVI
jgi:hypothetical protein